MRRPPRIAERSLCFDRLEARTLLATLTVNTVIENSPIDGLLSLREAIEVVNGTLPVSYLSPLQQNQVVGVLGQNDTIDFHIAGDGVHTIAPRTAFPTITKSVTIDGYSQPGSSPNTLTTGDNAVLLIELDGEFASSNVDGLEFTSSGQNVVQGLVINRFGLGRTATNNGGGNGIRFGDTAGGDVVRGCFLGVDPAGTTAEVSTDFQAVFSHETGPVFGGTDPGSRNVVSNGSEESIEPSGVLFVGCKSAQVMNNYIGVDATGLNRPVGSPTTNSYGLVFRDSTGPNMVGGVGAGRSNLISAIELASSTTTLADGDVTIENNLIGVDATGKRAIPRRSDAYAIQVYNSRNNVIGGVEPGAGNVIAALNAGGIEFYETDRGGDLAAKVYGNWIGTDKTGTMSLGEYWGVVIRGSGVQVGANLSMGAPNVLAHNVDKAVYVLNDFGDSGTSANNVFGVNSIYENASPTIRVDDPSKTVGTPYLTAVIAKPGGVEIKGTVLGPLNTFYGLTFYSNPSTDTQATAQGKTFLGRGSVTTDVHGIGRFDVTLAAALNANQLVTAFAAGANPSEFSYGLKEGGKVTAAADVTGLGVSDQVVFRPSTAQWFVLPPGSLTLSPAPVFGAQRLTDIPILGDFDGVGHAELAVFRPSTAEWFVLGPSGGRLIGTFGDTNLNDIPVPGDYDGVGHTELAVFRPSTSQWFVLGPNGGRLLATFGDTNLKDIPVAGDYDGVGYTEPAVFRQSNAHWYILGPNGGYDGGAFGATNLTDIPLPADYDGLGSTQRAVFRPSTAQWFADGATAGHLINTFGAMKLTDVPPQAPIGALVKLGKIGGVKAAAAQEKTSTIASSTGVGATTIGVEAGRTALPRATNVPPETSVGAFMKLGKVPGIKASRVADVAGTTVIAGVTGSAPRVSFPTTAVGGPRRLPASWTSVVGPKRPTWVATLK